MIWQNNNGKNYGKAGTKENNQESSIYPESNAISSNFEFSLWQLHGGWGGSRGDDSQNQGQH